MRLTRWLTALALLGVSTAGAVGAAGPAEAGNGPITNPTGYTVQVAVHFSGDAAPGHGAVRSVAMQPSCWWAPPAGAPYQDAVRMLAWYDAVTASLGQGAALADYGPREIWVAAAAAAQAGTPMSWYVAHCRNPADLATWNGGTQEYIEPGHGPQTWVTWLFKAFPTAQGAPPPRVAPEDLARAAWAQMVLPVPAVDRNPKIGGAGASTLVGLPTWFWVVDPASLGDANGDRHIRAQVLNVWAEVTAHTGGLTLSSPAGGAHCDPAQARVAYTPSASDASACTVQFAHASTGYPGGDPVTAAAGWHPTWVGSNGPGDPSLLGDVTRNATVQVPVAEVQTIVTP